MPYGSLVAVAAVSFASNANPPEAQPAINDHPVLQPAVNLEQATMSIPWKTPSVAARSVEARPACGLDRRGERRLAGVARTMDRIDG